jgi:hypothetical protein
MDEQAYKAWWNLHVRKACGETLSEQEQQDYEAGVQELDAEESIPSNIAELRRMKASILALEAENALLRERKRQLDAEISALESSLDPEVKELLQVGN